MKESNYSWNEYTFLFTQKAQNLGFSPSKIHELLIYAAKLKRKGLPIIYDLKHLSFLTGFTEKYIDRSLENPQNFYRVFEIAKKNGHSRKITEPLPGLKEIQYWILENIIKKTSPNKLNNAYIENQSIVTNAKFHTKQNKVLNIDIEKYFDNITNIKVREFFEQMGYRNDVANCLAGLITLNNGLPQGSPSSPYLSSVLTKEIDIELLDFCQEKKLRYSRYADDISISGEFNPTLLINNVKDVLLKHGFKINAKKTTLKKSHQRQMVTGIVVNKKLSIKKSLIKALRQEVYYIFKFGLEKHIKIKQINRKNYINVLQGKLNYFMSVKKNDNDLVWINKTLKAIVNRQKSS